MEKTGEPQQQANTLEDGRFQFLSFTNPADMRSATSIQAIRQHAMREIGRSRRRSKRPLQFELMLDMRGPGRRDSFRGPRSPTSWWVGAGPMDPFIKYPIDLGHGERELVALSKYMRH